MNKKIGIILGAALLVFLLIGASSAGWFDFLGDDSATENDDTTLVVGFDAEFPPYGYKNDTTGEYEGFDLDLAQEVCDRNNWTLVKQPINWDSKDAELDSGSIDCIWNGFTISPEREDQYTWSKPYINNKQVFVVKADSGIKSSADLKGKIVETQKASSALEALQEQKQLSDTFDSLTEVADYNTAFMDLESGACDAVAMDIGVAQHQISSKENPSDYYILPKEISSEKYGIGFKKGNDELRDQVQATLDEMFEDGTVMKIAQKYADKGIPGSLIIE